MRLQTVENNTFYRLDESFAYSYSESDLTELISCNDESSLVVETITFKDPQGYTPEAIVSIRRGLSQKATKQRGSFSEFVD